jgi:hypothetical protein
VNLGLLDLPAPLLDALDGALNRIGVPAFLRVATYAAASAWMGMALYRRLSDQRRLAEAGARVVLSQRALARHDGDFATLRVLILANLRATSHHLALTLRPALLATLPLLFALPWLSNRFDFREPEPGTPVSVCAQPGVRDLHWQASSAATVTASGCWLVPWPDDETPARLSDSAGRTLLVIPNAAKSDSVEKFGWFNWLIANPAGYLPSGSAIARVHIALSQRQILFVGPAWFRGWVFWYFLIALVVSLWLKWRWRLQ